MSQTTSADDLCRTRISNLGAQFRSRELSPVEVTEAVLERINQYDSVARAFITVTAELAMEQAKQAEQELNNGIDRGPLHGITFSLKDNIETKGIRTSCASMVNPHWIPERDAVVYKRLREAGAILVGKANLLEYAFSMNDAYPPPLNPWRSDRTSSGSSSGSAVAVAHGMSHVSIGTDTGGSGRVPASINGVVGLKATHGLVSCDGVVPLSYSLDHTTVLARNIEDSALTLQSIAEPDQAGDSYRKHLLQKIGNDISGLRIGVARGYTYENVDEDVDKVLENASHVFKELRAEIVEVDLPNVELYVGTHNAIMHAEAATVHYGAHRQQPDNFGATALNRLDLGAVIPATDYIRAQQVRKLLRGEYRRLFDDVHILFSAVTPMRPGPAGAWSSTTAQGFEIDRRIAGPEYTGIYNITGLPAIAVPAGFSSEGTPIGIQLAGRGLEEATVFHAAHAFEQATNWHLQHPPLPELQDPAI